MFEIFGNKIYFIKTNIFRFENGLFSYSIDNELSIVV